MPCGGAYVWHTLEMLVSQGWGWFVWIPGFSAGCLLLYALETLQQNGGLVLFRKPQNDRGLKQHSCQGTQAWSVAMVGEWSQKVKEHVLHFFADRKYILNLSSTCARASRAAVTSRLAQPAVVHHWVSSTQHGSWQGSHLHHRLQALIPVTPWGHFLVFVLFRSILREVAWWDGGVWMWSLCSPVPRCVLAFTGCGSDLPNFCACAKTMGDCSRVVSSKILVPHHRSVTFPGCGKGLHPV